MNELCKYIEYTNLSAMATKKQIEDLCDKAKSLGLHAVCINPFYVKTAYEILKKTNVKICTVVGFPLGQNTSRTKIFETHDAIKNGADEIDMVINVSRLKAGDVDFCIDEINTIKKICKRKILKVIVETCLLDQKELELACQIVLESNADFIKTSTGFNGGGATIKDVEIIRTIVEDRKGIKASGGIKKYNDAVRLIRAGATRIGTSTLYPEIDVVNIDDKLGLYEIKKTKKKQKSKKTKIYKVKNTKKA